MSISKNIMLPHCSTNALLLGLRKEKHNKKSKKRESERETELEKHFDTHIGKSASS